MREEAVPICDRVLCFRCAANALDITIAWELPRATAKPSAADARDRHFRTEEGGGGGGEGGVEAE